MIWTLGGAVSLGGPPYRAFADSGTADVVFVTEDVAVQSPGCDAISVFDAPQRLALHRGETRTSPGRLAVSPDHSLVFATQSNTHGERFVYTLVRRGNDLRRWTAGSLTGPSIATFGGLAFLPGNDQILLSTAGGPNPPPLGLPYIYAPNSRPYEVRKYTLPSVPLGNQRLGRHDGSVALEGVAVEIFPTADGRFAHLVTDVDTVHTIDVSTMTEMDSVIHLAKFEGPTGKFHATSPNRRHATITSDERYLVTNRWSRNINVVDLLARRSSVVSLPGDVAAVGGVALNRGWLNPGLLAVHAGGHVIIYEFSPDGPVRELARAAIGAPKPYDFAGPLWSIAWSGSGAHVIAAADQGGEFAVVEVADGGNRAQVKHTLTACRAGSGNVPNDVLTLNGVVAPPSPTATATPSPTSTRSPTATPTHAPTSTRTSTAPATPSAPPSLTPNPTPTPVPRPLFLPILLRERCTPDKQRTDVALVIDASSSMLEQTPAGRTKLAAAIKAAGIFLGQLQLDAGDQAAIVAFNADAQLLQPLTADRSALDAALASIRPARQTCLVCGVDVGADELASDRRDPDNTAVMIVLTDGLSNSRPASEAVTRAAEAKRNGVVVYTIGLGTALDFLVLEQIASEPAQFYRAPDAEQLADIYRQIAVEIPCPAGRFWPRR
jgi:Mg-chelatase subunit ChlD